MPGEVLLQDNASRPEAGQLRGADGRYLIYGVHSQRRPARWLYKREKSCGLGGAQPRPPPKSVPGMAQRPGCAAHRSRCYQISDLGQQLGQIFGRDKDGLVGWYIEIRRTLFPVCLDQCGGRPVIDDSSVSEHAVARFGRLHPQIGKDELVLAFVKLGDGFRRRRG